MKFYLVMAREKLSNELNAWAVPYDKQYGVVVRAENEQQARQLAQSQAGNEQEFGDVWLDARYTRCEELSAEGTAEILLRDFYSG